MTRLVAREIVVSRGKRCIVRLASLLVFSGEVVVVTGTNGAGKSSLLLACAGLLPLESGDVHVAGRNIVGLPPLDRARHLAIAVQSPVFPLDLRVREFVSLGRRPHLVRDRSRFGLLSRDVDPEPGAVDEALDELALQNLEQRRLGTLSGGEQRRAQLARVFAQRTPIVLLDEPTTHLDEAMRRRVTEALRRRARAGAAVMLVTHESAIWHEGTRSLRLQGGALVSAPQRQQSIRRDVCA